MVDHLVLTATSVQGDELFQGRTATRSRRPRRPGDVYRASRLVRLAFVAENAKAGRIDRRGRRRRAGLHARRAHDHDARGVSRPDVCAPIQLIRAAEALPAVAREFSRTERILIRFQVYGRAGSARSGAVLNNLGNQMAAFPEPTRLPDGTLEVELGLGPLAPGEYVIEIVGEAGTEKAQSLLAIRVTA